MPRLAPQMGGKPCVLEHRITFGTYERKQITEAVDAYRRDKAFENIPNILMGVGAVGAGVGVISLGYGLYKVAGGIWELAGKVMPFNIPDWVDTDLPVWSDKNRENFREEYPTLFQQALKGPEILVALFRQ